MTGLFRKCFAFLGAVLVVLGGAIGGGASVANASSYLRLDGVTVDPIQYRAGICCGYSGNHSYSGPNLEPGVQAPNANFDYYANLTLASLDHANLSGAYLRYTDLSSADLSFANLSGANLSGADLSSADLSFANLSSASIGDADFSSANLRHSDLTYSYAGKGSNAYFVGADLTGATLDNSDFFIMDFTNADLSGASLANIYSSSWQGDFVNAVLVGADLSSTNFLLQHGDFTGATYSTGSLSNRTLFPTGFDPVAAGMILVPEPGTVLLVGIGLAGMSAVSQRNHRRGTTRRV